MPVMLDTQSRAPQSSSPAGGSSAVGSTMLVMAPMPSPSLTPPMLMKSLSSSCWPSVMDALRLHSLSCSLMLFAFFFEKLPLFLLERELRDVLRGDDEKSE
eukprot:CAMPEP_0173426046 /NCGR_PEP_ID=MMETSP1357-20121228/5610_1 /TAXON_ID=77926 /ORGANISM="Hemiselmis rufescens, Strain PCC563" /LENGTH=100 /DNA_ID=CAMNT_0014389617 /DNA_START=154 /DNA_END=456 /DNA_ORIENTATION=-